MDEEESYHLYQLSELAERVDSREALVAFVAALSAEHEANGKRWTNPDLSSYLEAMSGYAHDMPGGYANASIDIEAVSPWRIMAQLLLAGAEYE